MLLLEELLVNFVLPELAPAEILNFCLSSSEYLQLIQDESLWKFKCVLEAKDVYPRNSLTWKEHYFSFWMKLPFYQNGDRIGRRDCAAAVFFQPETHFVFPPALNEIVLANFDRKNTPLLKVSTNTWIAKRLFQGEYPLRVNRALVMSLPKTKDSLKLVGSSKLQMWRSSNQVKLKQYQESVRNEFISSNGTNPIYGYYYGDWVTFDNCVDKFVLIDNRNGANQERFMNDYTNAELDLCAAALECSKDKIPNKLEQIEHLLEYDWSI
jgi:hypothetical protein